MRSLIVLLAMLSCSGAVCEAGRQVACACPGGGTGFQVCASDGSAWGDCACDGVDDTDTTQDTDVEDTDVACADLPDCGDCLACSRDGQACATEWAACEADNACSDLGDCLVGCEADPTCETSCIGAASGGESLGNTAITCSREECVTACE